MIKAILLLTGTLIITLNNVNLLAVFFRYATGRFQPSIDDHSQLTQMLAMNRDGMMMMQFMRPYVSNDAQVSCDIHTQPCAVGC